MVQFVSVAGAHAFDRSNRDDKLTVVTAAPTDGTAKVPGSFSGTSREGLYQSFVDFEVMDQDDDVLTSTAS